MALLFEKIVISMKVKKNNLEKRIEKRQNEIVSKKYLEAIKELPVENFDSNLTALLSKIHDEQIRNKNAIIITEIPYLQNKSKLVLLQWSMFVDIWRRPPSTVITPVHQKIPSSKALMAVLTPTQRATGSNTHPTN